MMASSIHSITFDCTDPARLAAFWMAALGYMVEEGCVPDEEGAALVDPHSRGPRLLFQPTPEGKSVKNRLHLDLRPDDSMNATVERLLSIGGRKVTAFDCEYGVWTVMQDLEGNEFCVERGPQDMR